MGIAGRFATVLFAAALCASAATAHADDLTTDKAADIRTLLTLTNASRIADQTLALIMQQIAPTLRSCKGCNERTPEIVQREIQQLFREQYLAPGGLLDRQIEIYHRHFTHDEIKALLAFQRSPIGIKFNNELPALQTEGAQAGREWGQTLAPELRRRIAAAMALDNLVTPPDLNP